ncbi:MAG: hypothetical protein ACFCUU_04970, partial [Cyclobacteriaceae bacterium]
NDGCSPSFFMMEAHATFAGRLEAPRLHTQSHNHATRITIHALRITLYASRIKKARKEILSRLN